MEKHEIFEQAIGTKFKEHNKEDLLSIGIAIGTNQKTYKDLYIAYSRGEAKYENNPRRGAKIEVEFNLSEDEILIKRLETVLKFNREQFLIYINLMMLCFGEIYPLGSVLELDEELLTKEFLRASGVKDEEEGSVRVMITDRFVPVSEDNDQFIIEYIARPFPYGEGTSMFLNRVSIKGMIHSGLADDVEETFVQELRQELVVSGKRSVAFLTDEELAGVIEERDKREDNEDNLLDGEVS